MRDRSSQPNNRIKGFTTVEVIIVLVLMLIMAGGLILGLVKWVDWTNFKRQNEYARSLFVAAENQLTEYAQSGQLEELSRNLEQAQTIDDRISNGTLTGQQGQVFSLESVWPESRGKGNHAASYQGNIVSVIATAEDYALYMKDKSEGIHLLEQEKTVIYDMVYSYLYDPTILKATICIEFAPAEGQIFSVLYSDIKTDFTYEAEESGGKKGIASIRSRESNFRKQRMIGYYGADCLFHATGNQVEKPSLSEIRLNNEDTLNLSFVVENAECLELNYELTIHDKITKRPVLSFVIDGSKLKNETDRENVRCDVTRYTYEGEESAGRTSVASFPILAWTTTDSGISGNSRPMIHVVLDGADLDASSEALAAYIEDYEEIMGNQANTDLGGYLEGFANTLSFHRFGVSTEDIYCTVKASGELYKTSATKQSNSENTYFGSYRENKGEEDQAELHYTLKNARHLYNIRYIEDYGDDASGTLLPAIYGKDMSQIIYQIEENIDWETFQSDSHALFRSGEKTGLEAIESFPAIRMLRQGSVMESEGITRHTIRGLKITEDSEEAAGLFLCNEGTLQSFILDKITVTGSQNVGAFCGVNRGTLDQLTVKNTENKSCITGHYNVGGIAGIVDVSMRYRELENYARVCGISDNTGKNKGNKNTESGQIGGIFGQLSLEKTTGTITVENCKNYGQIRALDHEVISVGGIVGKCNAEGGEILLTDCISSPWYTEEELKELLEIDENGEINGLKGSCVGGIVGWNIAGTIRNCTTRKYGEREAYILGDCYVGGIAGYNNGTIRGDKILSIASEVTGNHFVGGVVGYNDTDGVITGLKVAGGRIKGTGSFVGGFAGLNASESLLAGDEEGHYPESNPDQVEGEFCVGGTIGGNIMPTDKNINTVFYSDNFSGEVTARGAVAGGFIGYNRLLNGDKFKKNHNTDHLLRSIQKMAEDLTEVRDLSEIADIEKYLNRNVSQFGVSSYTITIQGNENDSDTQDRSGSITGGIYVGGVMGYNAAETKLTVKDVVNHTMVKATSAVKNEKEQPKRMDYAGNAFLYSYAGGIIGKVNENTVIDDCRNQNAGDVVTRGTYTGGICEVNDGYIKKCRVSDLGSRAADYVGGIAGVNKEGAWIEDTVFAEKTITGQNYVGGITAENFGTIIGTKIRSGKVKSHGSVAGGITAGNGSEKQTGGWLVLDGRMEVDVKTEGNYAGGVAGINYASLMKEDGSTKTVIKGLVRADNFAGGVIGENRSAVTISGFRNEADVLAEKACSGGIAAGSEGNLSGCENYGKIEGLRRCGGMIGVWKHHGGTLSDCVNYGTIRTRADEGCAGMVGCFYDIKEKVTMERCVNHGKIWGSTDYSCGGIVGYSQNENLLLELRECVNTGLIRAGDYNSGITAISNRLSEGSRIIGCRNYGYAFSGAYDNLNGIAPKNLTKNVTVEKCLNLSDLRYPLVNRTELKEKNNFYLILDENSESASSNGERNEGIGNPCRQELNGNQTFRLLTLENTQLGFSGFSGNLLDLFQLEEAKQDNSLKVCGDEKDNLRYVIYQQDDPFFNSMTLEQLQVGQEENQ